MKQTDSINISESSKDPVSVPIKRHRRVVDMTDIVTNTAHSRTPSDKSKKGNRKRTKKAVSQGGTSASFSESKMSSQENVQSFQEPGTAVKESVSLNILDNSGKTDSLSKANSSCKTTSSVSGKKAVKTTRKKKETGGASKSSSSRKAEKTPRKTKQIHRKPTPEQQQLNDYIINTMMLQSWLSHEWCSCITKLFPNTAALFTKGISFVQARLVNDFCITTDSLEAIVVDQITSIQIRHFDPNHWKKIIERLSDKAIFAAELLNGELTEDIINTFTEEKLPLFPTQSSEFNFSCNCGAEKMPCEHVCALLLAFAQTLKDFPFNILMIRGMSHENLIAQLNEKRSLLNINDKSKTNYNNEMPVKDINFGMFYAPRGDFSDIEFHISHESSTLIKRLGTPEAWSADHFVDCSIESCMAPIYEAVSREAEKLGVSDPWQISLSKKEREELEQHRLRLEIEQQKLALMHTQKRRQNARFSSTDEETFIPSSNGTELKEKHSKKLFGKVNRYQVRETKRQHLSRRVENSDVSDCQNSLHSKCIENQISNKSVSTSETRRISKPKKMSASQRRPIPDLSFAASSIPQEILAIVDNPLEKAYKIYEWLLKGGQTDVRTLARRTQLTKIIIQAFLTALCHAGFVRKIMLEDDKVKYEAL